MLHVLQNGFYLSDGDISGYKVCRPRFYVKISGGVGGGKDRLCMSNCFLTNIEVIEKYLDQFPMKGSILYTTVHLSTRVCIIYL